MKFPHLNLLFFIALLALTSCDKEKVALSNDELTQDSSIGMRCCDDATSQMLEDPRFKDFYDEYTNGVFDPVFAILDEFDIEELNNELIAFEECIESGGSYEDCLGQSPILARLIEVIEGFDMDMLLTLQDAFDYLNEDEFITVLIEAFDEITPNTDHRLNCFLQFRADIIKVIGAGSIAAIASGGAGLVTLFAGVILAKVNYCNCLYNNYGASC